MEQSNILNVVSGYSEPLRLTHQGYFIFDAFATHWGGGSITLERSPVGKNAFSVVQDDAGDVTLTSNGSRLVPGKGEYRFFCSGYQNMSGVEALLDEIRLR